MIYARNLERKYEIDAKEWNSLYKLSQHCTQENYFKWFQYRFLHNILATNVYLAQLKLIDSKLRSLCQKEKENLIHLFWKCEKVQILLSEIKQTFNSVSCPFNPIEQSLILGELRAQN